MTSNFTYRLIGIGLAILSAHPLNAQAQGAWRVNTKAAAGPFAQIDLGVSNGKGRASIVAFEYARQCDPMFSFIETTGTVLGAPTSQSVLTGTKIGVVVNGQFYTWHAAVTKYENGYEAAFGITNELFDRLVGKVDSLIYVTPKGERVSLPTNGFLQSIQSALDNCAKKLE